MKAKEIPNFLPERQLATGTQNVYVVCAVDGFNSCLSEIAEKELVLDVEETAKEMFCAFVKFRRSKTSLGEKNE